MKRNVLIVSLFFCILFCLIVSVSFKDINSFDTREDNTLSKNADELRIYDFQQPDKSVNSGKFGPAKQLGPGVNIHFVTGHETDLDMIAAAGFKFIRMDLGWQSIERTKGVYNWANFDQLTSNLEKRGIRPLYILDYSNSLYEETLITKDATTGNEIRTQPSPQHPESVAAFAKWAAAAAEHFKGRNVIWEIWNEPNIRNFWKPGPDVAQYTAMALATCKAVKALVPDAVIIGPGTSGIPFPYLESFLSSGVLEYLDAVSVHPYRGPSRPPETAMADYQKLREMIDLYAPSQKKGMPIISSEWGYSTFIKGVPLETQAAYIVRMQLANLLSSIPVSIWYDWKNDGADMAENEHNFGTLLPDLKLKPAYTTIQTLNKQLNGFTFSRRIDLKNENDYAMLFKNDKGDYKITAWTIDKTHSSVLNEKISKIKATTIIDGKGEAMKLKIEKDNLVLDLNELPQYIILPAGTKMK